MLSALAMQKTFGCVGALLFLAGGCIATLGMNEAMHAVPVVGELWIGPGIYNAKGEPKEMPWWTIPLGVALIGLAAGCGVLADRASRKP